MSKKNSSNKYSKQYQSQTTHKNKSAQSYTPPQKGVSSVADKETLVGALAYCVASDNIEMQKQIAPVIEELLAIRNNHHQVLHEGTLDRHEKEVTSIIVGYQKRINHILKKKDHSAELCLIYGGATKIKGYVFESSEIAEIRGASALLDWINTEAPVSFVKQNGLPRQCILYSSGGNIVAFAPIHLGETFARHIEHTYTEQTLTAQSVTVSINTRLIELAFGYQPDQFTYNDITKTLSNHANPIINELLTQSLAVDRRDMNFRGLRESYSKVKGFGELITVAASRAAARRDGEHAGESIRPISHEELTPWVEKCYTSDIRPASINDQASNDLISLSTERKRLVGRFIKSNNTTLKKTSDGWSIPDSIRRWDNEYTSFLKTHNLSRLNLPASAQLRPAQSFEEIASACSSKSIGVVYVDGNNLGQIYSTMSNLREYRRFSDKLTNETKTIVFRALQKHIKYETKIGNNHIQPFEIIAIGGDDCFIIVPGDIALQVAHDIGHAFNDVEPRQTDEHVKHRFGIQDTSKPSLSVSAGVVIADHKTPFFLLERLVNDLLKSAKRAARQYKTGTIDFISLLSLGAVSDSVDTIRQAYTYTDNTQLTARPFTWEELNFIIQRIHDMNKELRDESFNSHLYRIANVMHTQGRLASDLELQSTIYNHKKHNPLLQGIALATSYLTPAPVTTQTPLENMSLWHKHQDRYETILIDLMEIRDLVRTKSS